ncbi:NPCBM/NEW2 domain-containing protein [Priestia filamentosa]|uniref:hypothetical protein n=1 Tax=Priestia filamentosa TaxID=1402861 RepID=UPI00397A70FA
MKKLKRTMMGIGLAVLVLSGCSEKEETASSPEETKQETKNQGNENEKENQEEKEWTAKPLKVEKTNKVLYENEEGKVELVGYRRDKENYLEVALKYSGALTEADDSNFLFDMILDNSNAISFNKENRTEIRKEDKVEYHIYRSDDEVPNGIPIRTDVYVTGDEEEKPQSIRLKEPTDTVTIDGMEYRIGGEEEFELTRENEDMKISLETVDAGTEPNEFSVTGNIEFKKDLDEIPTFTWYQPDMKIGEETELRTNHEGDRYYEGASIHFGEFFELPHPLGYGKVNSVYFSVGNEFFAIDLDTGKELKKASISNFPNGDEEQLDTKTIEGFVDREGNRFYDALQIPSLYSNHGMGTPYFVSLPYTVSGYDELEFTVSPQESKSNATYSVKVYGSDFSFPFEEAKPSGTVLSSTTITAKSKAEKVNVDIKGEQKVVLYIESNTKSENDEEDLPIILSDITLTK